MMRKMPTFSMPLIFSRTVLDLVGQLLELVQVGAEDLDRVVALDAGERLHDVVADVLREVPVDAGHLSRSSLVHRLGELFLGPAAFAPEQGAASRAARPSLGHSFCGFSGTKISTL